MHFAPHFQSLGLQAAGHEKIMRQADPLEFLCKVCRGDRMEAAAKPGDKKKTWWHPTGDQRINAAQTLARKVMPDQKAVEVSGPLGEPLSVYPFFPLPRARLRLKVAPSLPLLKPSSSFPVETLSCRV